MAQDSSRRTAARAWTGPIWTVCAAVRAKQSITHPALFRRIPYEFSQSRLFSGRVWLCVDPDWRAERSPIVKPFRIIR